MLIKKTVTIRKVITSWLPRRSIKADAKYVGDTNEGLFAPRLAKPGCHVTETFQKEGEDGEMEEERYGET